MSKVIYEKSRLTHFSSPLLIPEDFLMFSGGSKGNIGKKWDNTLNVSKNVLKITKQIFYLFKVVSRNNRTGCEIG